MRRRFFKRFYQADLRERKSKAGSGLGLSIGRWIADAHGAELTVESIPQQGSVFQMQLPGQTASANPAATETASKTPSVHKTYAADPLALNLTLILPPPPARDSATT